MTYVLNPERTKNDARAVKADTMRTGRRRSPPDYTLSPHACSLPVAHVLTSVGETHAA
jgi:hypothetical protein